MGIGILCMLGVFALWSVIPVLVKLLFSVFDPFTIAFLRLLQGAAVVSVAFFVRGHTLRDIQWSWWHLIGGLGMSLNFSLYALALSYTTASAGSLVVQVQYVALTVLAVAVLHERLGVGKIAGMVLVLAGVAVIVGVREDVGHLFAPRYVLGNVLMLFSGLGWGNLRACQQGACVAGGDRGHTGPNDGDGCGGHGRTRRDPFSTALGADGGYVDCGARAGRVGHWLCVCFGLGGHEAAQCRAGRYADRYGTHWADRAGPLGLGGASDLESDWGWDFDLGRRARHGVCRAIPSPTAGPRLIFF